MTQNTVTAQTLKTWIDKDEVIVIDVREPAEFNSGHIAVAKSIPLSQVCASALPQYTGKKVVINCQRGARGTAACQKLHTELKDAELYNLEGGISAWIDAGFPVTGQAHDAIPLIQQVQISVGIWILVSIVLTLTVSPLLSLLAAIPGIGLIYAGLTGTCGLTKILALMPWNRP